MNILYYEIEEVVFWGKTNGVSYSRIWLITKKQVFKKKKLKSKRICTKMLFFAPVTYAVFFFFRIKSSILVTDRLTSSPMIYGDVIKGVIFYVDRYLRGGASSLQL